MMVITTVGTSLFENYMSSEVKILFRNEDEKHEDISQALKILRDRNASEFENDNIQTAIAKIKPFIENLWLKGISKNQKGWYFPEEETTLNEYASAEIESILKIQEEQNVFTSVYLLATDTVLSRLAAKMLAEFLNKEFSSILQIHFNPQLDVIEHLRINDFDRFKKGLVNLSDRFYQIADSMLKVNLPQNIVLNITGGYKGIIPYLSLLGQINQTKIQYTFENTGTLITVPQLPIKQNDDLFEKHWESLHLLKNEILSKYEYAELFAALNVCFDEDGDDFCFNFLGEALWKKYISNYFVFYCSDDVLKDINKDDNIYNEVVSSFYHTDQRLKFSKRKPQPHNDHLCYGKGRFNPRVFYFEEDEKVVIYKVFQKHNNEYENYLERLKSKKMRLETIKEDLLEKSAIRKLKIKA